MGIWRGRKSESVGVSPDRDSGWPAQDPGGALTRGWLWLGLVALIGLVALLAGAWQNDWSDQVWLEVAKGGVQLLGVGILGGALTFIWRDIAVRRERESERIDKMFAELASMDDLYNQVRTVRRTLRSLGFDPGGSEVLLTKQQASGLLEQGEVLYQVQLRFEYKLKLFRRTGLLGSAAPGVVRIVEHVVKYLSRVRGLWQALGSTLGEETPLAVVSHELALLLSREGFREGMAAPMDGIWILISREAFGKAPTRL